MRKLPIALVLLVMPAPAFAQEQDVCAALNRVAAAAREPQPFASVRRALAGGEAVVPGFRAGDCRATAEAFSCVSVDFTGDHFDDWPQPLTCPGLSPATPARWRPGHRDRQHAFALSGLRFEYGTSCWGCAGGVRSYFSVSLSGRGRPEE